MEINGAVRQAVAPSGVARPAPPPEAAARAGAASPPAAPSGLSREAVIALAADAGATVPHGARLRVDETTDRIVLEVLDDRNEVVKQIPPEAWLRALAQTRQITGLILDRST